MRLTKRGKKRILLLGAACGIMAAGAAVLLVARDLHRTSLADEARERGLAAHASGAYEEALPDLSYAVSFRKDDVEALLAFADARARVREVNRQHLRSAVALYGAALKIDSGNRRALEALLDLYGDLGYRREVEEIAERLVALDARHRAALEALASLALFEERHEELSGYAERLAELEPGNLEWAALAIVAMEGLGASEEERIEACRARAEAWEGDGRFLLLLAQVERDLGRTADARTSLDAAVARGAEESEVLGTMLAMLEVSGRRDAARDLIDRMRAAAPEAAWIREASVRDRWRRMDLDGAEAELASARIDGEPELLRWSALVAAARGNDRAARAELERLRDAAPSLDPAERDAALAWADAVEAGLVVTPAAAAEAVEACRAALDLEPRSAVLHAMHAAALERVGERELAAQSAATAVRLDPWWRAPRVDLARNLLALGRAADAHAALAPLVERGSEADLRTWLLYARAWMALGSTGDALALSDRESGVRVDLVGLLNWMREAAGDRWHPEISALLLEALARDDRRDEADLLVRAALEDDEASTEALIALAEACIGVGLDRVEPLIDRAATRGGDRGRIEVARARLALAQGRADEGLRLLGPWVADDPRGTRRDLARRLGLASAGSDPARLAAWLDAAEDPVAAADLLLAGEAAWSDAALVDRAIGMLREAHGDTSPRVRLYEAGALARFQPDDPEALARATAAAAEALDRSPDSRYGLLLMSALLLRGDDPLPAEALRHLEHAARLHPDDPAIRFRLVALLQEQGEFDRARRHLAHLARIADDETTRSRAAQLLARQGDWDAAIERLAGGGEMPTAEPDRLRLADLLARAGRLDDAERTYRAAAEAPGASLEATASAAEFLARQGRDAEGQQLLEDRAARRPELRSIAALGVYAAKHGAAVRARAALDAARDLGPRGADDHAALAELHLALGDAGAALDAAERGLAEAPDDAGLRRILTTIAFARGGAARETVLERLREVGTDDPALAATLALLPAVDPSAPTPGAALRAQASALVIAYPGFAPAWRVAARVHERAGDLEEAARVARRGATRLPGDADLALESARLLLRAGRPAEAADAARAARQRDRGGAWEADILLARAELAAGRPGAAREALAPHATRLAEADASELLVAVAALIGCDALDAALGLGVDRLARDHDFVAGWIELAGACDPPVGEAMLEAAVTRAPESSERDLRLAVAWAQLGARGSGEGWARAEALLAALPDAAVTAEMRHLLRASIAAGRDELAAAESEYRALLRLHPDHPVALNNLALLLAKQGDACTEAVALARRAAEVLGGGAAVADTLGRALLCADRAAEAESVLLAAIREGAEGAALRLTLARTLLALGRPDEAATARDAARRLVPDPARRSRELAADFLEVERLLESHGAVSRAAGSPRR